MNDTPSETPKNEEMREALEKRPKRTIPTKAKAEAGNDDKSIAEAKALASGELETKSARNEHTRTERFRDHVARAIIFLFWIVFVCIVLAGGTWFFHLVMPTTCHFLTPAQTDKIGNQLFGGIVSAFVSGYAKKRLN